VKAYILTEDDFKKLLLRIDRNPKHGYDGGSSQVLSKEEEEAHDKAHRFFNYHIRMWMDEVKS
jgi:hypothetical protein